MDESTIKEITSVELEDWVSTEANLMIVEFWNKESGTCHIMEPIYQKLAISFKGEVRFFRFHIDQDFLLSGNLTINRVPSYAIYKWMELVEILEGTTSYKKIHALLTANMN